VIVVETLVLLTLSPPMNAVSIGLIAVIILLAGLLLLGSKIAWVFWLIGAASALVGPLLFHQPIWGMGTGILVLICLLVPASRSFVWSPKPWLWSNRPGIYLLARLNEFQNLIEETRQRIHRTLFALGFGILLAAPLINRLEDYHYGGGQDQPAIDALWAVVSSGYLCAKLGFAALLAVAAYGYLRLRRAGLPPRDPGGKSF
jgi:hypothetical protein